MERVREISPYVPSRSMSRGVWAWIIQRVTSVVLLVLVPLKILSGYAAVGKLASPGLATLHDNVVVDVLIMAALIFHTLYGLRVMLIEYGMAAKATWLFNVFTGVGVVILLASLWLAW